MPWYRMPTPWQLGVDGGTERDDGTARRNGPLGGKRMKSRYQNRIELLQGTLDLLVLQTLQWGPQHGYGISQAIRTNSGEVLQVDTGSLYPALHRLERQKWI